jgi:formimidoylglutamate deiminase
MYHAANAMSPEDIYRAARMAFLEMLLSGITAVGEFHYVHQDLEVARAILRAGEELGLGVTLLRTAYVRAGWKKDPDPGQARFLTPDIDRYLADTDEMIASGARIGVAPHSVRAVPLDYLRRVAEYARERRLPLHMHVSEQPAEVEACVGEYGRRPVELLHENGILDESFTAVHAIHITDEEARFLGKSTVCACPTSERNLGDGAVPADKLFEVGARICFGSDSNVQIDILEDARELEYHLRMNRLERAVLAPDNSREGLARRLFESATESGARSLLAPGGRLEAGRAADFFTIDLNDCSVAGADRESLLGHVVFSLERTAVRDVCVGGKLVVCDGRHRLQEEIVSEFGEVQRNLWR